MGAVVQSHAMDSFPADAVRGSPILFFAIALAIGLLIGSERERNPVAVAGLRTFALIALLGAICGMLADEMESGWILGAGLASVAATMIVASRRLPADKAGTTTVIATMVTFGLGAMIWVGYPSLAVMLAITTTILLYFKPQLEGLSRALSHQDWISMLRLAVLSLIVLPILPDHGYGPYQALNPFNIWLMVVLISGISLAGYVALRIVGTRYGGILLGLFGGLVSSTATTLVYGRAAREREALRPLAVGVIVIANTVLLVRIALITALLAPELVGRVAMLFAAPFAIGVVGIVRQFRHTDGRSHLPLPEVANPAGLTTSLSFGALYGAVLLAAAWLSDIAGGGGLYLVAFVSGATDVDAITLSMLRLLEFESIVAPQAAASIGLALVSNNLFKVGLLAVTADRTTRNHAGAILILMSIAVAAGVAWEGSAWT